MTFGICLFIVLMQFLWRYIDDVVGKGFGIPVLAEFLLYAGLTLVPMALPLAILLASLMTFGNLGERLELLAMKAAGISLIRIMRPLIVIILFISVGAFFFQNNVMPVAQVKLFSLVYSMRHKSPELEIPESTFYSEISGYNVYVKSKDKTGLLKNVMIYDYKDGYNNANIIVADSGRLKASADKLFLVLTLYNGESFRNLKQQTGSRQNQNKEAVPYQRETFGTREILIEFDDNFERTDESFLQNNYMGKNMQDLQTSIDTMTIRLDSIKAINAQNTYETSYLKTLSNHEKVEDGVPENNPDETRLSRRKKYTAPVLTLNFDSLFQAESPNNKATLLTRAKNNADNVKTENFFRASSLGEESKKLRLHKTEWHSKFTLCFACMVFFFIGAPLGAIIRKGGLGMPVVISVVFYIFYYIVNNIGYKMARDGVWLVWQGMWLSSAVLTPLGVFLTHKAVNDSVILNADTYLNALKNLIGKRSGRKIEKKEVIIFTPDYKALLPRLDKLSNDCGSYLNTHKRWIGYFTYWKQGGKDLAAKELARETESIVEELANSDQMLILNKLMDYPSGTGDNPLSINFKQNINLIIGLIFPIGIPVYLLAIYQRKLLRSDIRAIQKTSQELQDIINSH